MTGELNDQQIKNILSSQVIGRLACSDGKQPYMVPVSYSYDGDYIYCQTNEGVKLKMLRKNPAVCFEVDVVTDMRNWQSVVITGKFEELHHEEATKAREVLFNGAFGLMTGDAIHSHQHEVTSKVNDDTRVKEVMYRIKIKEISGRYEKA